MNRRAGSADSESLDLLLDTISNVFGGVIFIAILLALITTNSTVEVTDNYKAQLESLELANATAQIERQIQQLEAAIDELQSTEETLNQIVDPAAASRVNALTNHIEREGQRTATKTAQLQQWLLQYQAYRQNESQSIEAIETEIRALQSEIVVLSRQEREINDDKSIAARLPVERLTEKSQIVCIVDSSKLYPVPVSGGVGVLLANDLGNAVQIEETRTAIIISPRPTRGIAIDGPENQGRSVESLLRLLSPNTHFLDFFVTPSGVDEFGTLRKACVLKGFEYNIHPLESLPMVAAPTDTVTVQ